MLTDIFADRYASKVLWTEYTRRERKLIVQTFSILKEQLQPYYDKHGEVSSTSKEYWSDIHDRLAVELGMKELGPKFFVYEEQWQGKVTKRTGTRTELMVCENWMLAEPVTNTNIDEYIKERLSLVEIAFRRSETEAFVKNLTSPSSASDAGDHELYALLAKFQNDIVERTKAAIEELNTRFQQAGCKLHYHNGFIQISEDALLQAEVEEPFWALLADSKWQNVDTDMKEALDRRDSGGRDPAFYAARALESTIKIISKDKGWAHGGEKGASNYIESIAKKSAKFIEQWEAEELKHFFTKVRNPLGHGPGGEKMPTLTSQQTDLAIERCMSWIKSLILRL